MTKTKKRFARLLAILLVVLGITAFSLPVFAQDASEKDPEFSATQQLEAGRTLGGAQAGAASSDSGGLDSSVVFMIVLYIVGLVIVIYIFLIRGRRGRK